MGLRGGAILRPADGAREAFPPARAVTSDLSPYTPRTMTAELPIVELSGDYLPSGPWLYSRLCREPRQAIEAGALVELQDADGRFFGHGLYNPNSDIRVRILSTGKRSDLDKPRQFLLKQIAAADRLRKKTLRLPEVTEAYRMVHAEGDDMPGLVVDRFGDVIVCEHHSLGFWLWRADVTWALKELYPDSTVYHRVPKSALRSEGFDVPEPEDHPEIIVEEHGVGFVVKPAAGHKTGFFCDQRDNRQLVASLARGGDVLDLCCNAGGFALHAKAAGATRVSAVDLDEKVLDRAIRSAKHNDLEIRWTHGDIFEVLRREQPRARTVILDPHKIVRDRNRMDQGLATYGDMNTLALGAVKPGGLFATFSCSGAVDLATFVGTVFRAARRAERGVRLLRVLEAGPDHPQRPDFTRSRYLKGLLLAVD
jgi:23S rRNA (cytosine1962-C5)-methyltransferase